MALLAAREVGKAFGGEPALDGVTVEVRAGEVHGLLGANGAGKTTLVSVLGGLLRPDRGTVELDGRPVALRTPADAIRAGVGVVPQHFALVPTMTVAENLALGGSRRRRGAAVAVPAPPVDPATPVAALTMGERQRVEIHRCLHRGARLLLLDEPTSVLGPEETGELLATLRRLAGAGHGVLLVSHKLAELRAVTDRITVLRSGRVVSTVPTAGVPAAELARLMVGGPAAGPATRTPRPGAAGPGAAGPGAPVLVVRALAAARSARSRLAGVDLTVRAGEVLGVAGVPGGGGRELVDVLAGLLPPTGGSVEVDGVPVEPAPRRLRAAGVRVVPEDRQAAACLPDLTLADNLVVDRVGERPYSRFGLLRPRAITAFARDCAADFDIRGSTRRGPLRALSGGNQQRAVLARELTGPVRVLVAAEPTQGLDVAGVTDVHGRLRDLRDRGVAVLLVSADPAELAAVADRIAVLHAGRVVATLRPDEVDPARLGLLLGGVR